MGDIPLAPPFRATPRRLCRSGRTIGPHKRLNQVSNMPLVARVNTVTAVDRHQAVHFARWPYPWVGVSYIARIGNQKARKHSSPNANARVRREFIFDIGPLNMGPIVVVVSLLG